MPSQVDLAPLAGYKCFFSGGKARSAGVGIAVRQSLAVCVQGFFFVSDRLLAVLFLFGDVRFTVLVAYAPAHGGGAESERSHGLAVESFWESVVHTLGVVVPGEYRDKVVFLGDFNARVGRGGDTGSPFAAVLGDGLAADVGHVDDSATSLLNFCVAQGYEVADSWFSNAEVGSATWVSPRYSPDWFTLNGAAMSKVIARQWRTRKAYLAAPGSKPKRVLWKAAQRATLQLCRRLKQQFWTDVGVRLSAFQNL